MSKRILDTLRVQTDYRYDMQDITKINILNYGTVAATIAHNGVAVLLPPAVDNIPVAAFERSEFGHPFDIDIDIKFKNNQVGDLIIFYSRIKQC